MTLSLLYRLVGCRTVTVSAADTAAFLEICRRHAIPYAGFQSDADGGCTLTLTLPYVKQLLRHAEEESLPLSVGDVRGLPRTLLALARRPGLIVGALVGILLYLSASGVLWDIRITGNTAVSDSSVMETLAACGFSVGTPLRGFRADVLENQVLLADERLAWISVNRRGTVAYVEVREAAKKPLPPSDAPADIVAAMGGVIERVELEEGNILVAAGDTVSPGRILVSGLYDSERYGIRFTRAKARVYARTVREITVTIPLAYEQKCYFDGTESTSGDICQEKMIIFFGKCVKFSKKTGNIGVLCDTIEREELCTPKKGVGFPISVRTVWYLPYTMTTVTRTPAEAEALAYVELAREINSLPGGAELIKKTVTTQIGKEAFILRCTLTCIEDIGTVREIEVGGS